ncbi:uncharacterized protein LOC119720706 [Patiria miniata]|uniref:Uncharacterized protein n=1 Tax=Patiria miniata TaxID=46514 RepID=A0A913Z603_PATMI|nr:uncharacterized protein LOC119720706 [Patiria miniata]
MLWTRHYIFTRFLRETSLHHESLRDKFCNCQAPDMALSCTKLEFVLLLTVCIYGAKVVLVFMYVGELSPKGGALDGQVYRPDAAISRLNLERMRRHEDTGNEVVKSQNGEKFKREETVITDKAQKQNGGSKSKADSDGGKSSPDTKIEKDQAGILPGSAVAVPIQPPSNAEDSRGINGAFFDEVLASSFDHSNEKCQDVFMVALINSQPNDQDFRMAVRETWADTAMSHQLGVLTMFVLGSPSDDSLKSSVFQENERHDDILMGNFRENIKNSTLKLLLGLNWVTSRCSSAKFVFAGDDHMFVIYERLVRDLRALKSEESIPTWRGRISPGSRPVRDRKSRYYVSEKQYPGKRYPDFCTSEAGFVLSIDAAKNIFSFSWDEPVIPLPDVFTGVLAKKAGIRITDDESFTFGNLAKNVCEVSKVATTRGLQSVDHLTAIWKNATDPKFRRNCPEPDLNLVLGSHTNNLPYVERTLQLRLDHPGACYDSNGHKEDIFLLVLISTLPRHFELRRAIRETWGEQSQILGENLRLLFVMGHTQTDIDLIQKQVKQEDDEFGDIIQADFAESFHNLTLKVVMGLKWVTENCRHATYMYKGDDDMFVNFKNIISYLRENRVQGSALTRFFLGSVLYRSVRVTRSNSKYYVPDILYSGRYFPPYCSGGGYVISSDVIPEMYHKSLETAFIPIDDAYQGILASKIGLKPTAHKGFKNWGAKTDGCSLRDVMVVHGFKSPDALQAVWKNYTMPAEDCSDDVM